MADGLRELVYNTLVAAPSVLAAGLPATGVYPNNAPDSPAERRWIVLRWGPASPRAGRDTTVKTFDFQIWYYDREPDYGIITEIMRAVPPVLRALEAKPTGRGWVSSIEDQGQGPDLWDQVYQASVRSNSFRIVASGE